MQKDHKEGHVFGEMHIYMCEDCGIDFGQFVEFYVPNESVKKIKNETDGVFCFDDRVYVDNSEA